MGFTFSVQNNLPTASAILKQINYGTAVGLTKTAKEAQAAEIEDVPKKFTYRNRWLPASNKFGIRIRPATPSDREAHVYTNASWLQKQKSGGAISAGQHKRVFPYTYHGQQFIAIPTSTLRPKGSTKVLGPKLWPNNLKNVFVIPAKKSGVYLLMSRFAPGKTGTVAMYILVKQVSVKPKDAFFEPIAKVVNARVTANVKFEVVKALEQIRL